MELPNSAVKNPETTVNVVPEEKECAKEARVELALDSFEIEEIDVEPSKSMMAMRC